MGYRRLAEIVAQGRRRWTQEAIGDALGLPQPSVARRLSGDTEWRRDDLIKLAAHLQIPLEEIVAAYMADDPSEADDEPEPNGADHVAAAS